MAHMATEIEVYGATVNQFLRERNRSLRWLATEMERSPSYLSRQLRGERRIHPMDFYRMAHLLDVDPSAIGRIVVQPDVAA